MVSFTLWSNGYSLQSVGYSLQNVGYSPGVLNPPYTGNSSEWWLLFIFNTVVLQQVCHKCIMIDVMSPLNLPLLQSQIDTF